MKKIENPKTVEEALWNATVIMDSMNENIIRLGLKVMDLEHKVKVLEAKK